MRALVTGGCGFVGHHVIEAILRSTDWEIVVLDGLNYAASANRLEDMGCWSAERGRVTLLWHDLRAPIGDPLHERIGRVDYIFHLAAESHVERSLTDSIPFVQSNVLGTANLLEYAKQRQAALRLYVQFSTDEVYGPAPHGVFWGEWDRLHPSNPYAAAKAGGDMLALSFAHAFRMPIIITRTMNVFGERQHPEKYLPKTVRKIMLGEPVTIHATPAAVSSRCWIHARNAADALLFLCRSPKTAVEDIYNVTGEERTVLQLANRASLVLRGRELREEEVQRLDAHTARPGHDLRYALDGSKMRDMGWSPPRDLDESLDACVRWMATHPEWLGVQDATPARLFA